MSDEIKFSELKGRDMDLYQAGFMAAENDWRRSMKFSDLGEALYWVELAKADLMKRYGTIWPPAKP